MNQQLKFTKKQLEKLYIKQKLSLGEIGKKFECTDTNILYWLKKYNIKRRPAYYKKVTISKKVLEDLYWNKNISSTEIAKKFGITGRTVRKKLEKFEIPRKSVSEALTKKLKAPFTENKLEKAYFLGLRAGDFYAKWVRKSIRVQTTTTHKAQIKLLDNSFQNYGEIRQYLSKNNKRNDEWFVYTDLHSSFSFLVKKPDKIPEWALKNKNYFYQFLAAYMDCEGSWKVHKSHEKHTRFIFKIRTGDLKILKQVKEVLEVMKYHPKLYREKKKGLKTPYGTYTRDLYDLSINQKKDILKLIENLLPLSKHSEKTRKMQFILDHKNKKWAKTEGKWNKLRAQIKEEILKSNS
ncbi:MAG: LAGLIDADG family homing endonuclease [Candidatus Diapherotrites archaeon]